MFRASHSGTVSRGAELCLGEFPSLSPGAGFGSSRAALRSKVRGFAAAPVERHLADLAPTLRVLFGLPADHGPGAGFPLFELLGAAHK